MRQRLRISAQGTITDFDGKFELKVPKAVKYVVVSFVGYKNAKLDVTKPRNLRLCYNRIRSSVDRGGGDGLPTDGETQSYISNPDCKNG
ncbi:MAG: carboxypeptidase-like regulatory domain-containing protein [Butyricimonas paravirosa]